jgi:2-desacetyl-2-hydroxyethyl bacteriochlorophyllide A dehydrogenase
MKNQLHAIVFEAPDKVALGKFELGPLGPTEIIVKTHYTLVSAGTELRVLGGHYGSEGKFPLIPGYSVVGEVTTLGSEAQGFRVGDLVSCRNPRPVPGVGSQWGGQASLHVYTTVGEDRPVLLPAGAKTLDYVIAEISAISLRGVEAAAAKSGESAVVIGQGLIGAFSAGWLRARGCRVIVTDVENKRLERALAGGVAAAINGRDADTEARLGFLLNGGADIVVESSGTSAGALLAYRLLRKKPQAYGSDYKVEPIGFYHADWPRLIMQANYLEPVSINPFSFVPGEGVVILAPKDRGVEDRQKAVEAIRQGVLSASAFFDKVTPFTEAPQAYRALQEDKNNTFSVVFDWTKS